MKSFKFYICIRLIFTCFKSLTICAVISFHPTWLKSVLVGKASFESNQNLLETLLQQ